MTKFDVRTAKIKEKITKIIEIVKWNETYLRCTQLRIFLNIPINGIDLKMSYL